VIIGPALTSAAAAVVMTLVARWVSHKSVSVDIDVRPEPSEARAAFLERLEQEIARCRAGGPAAAVLLIDIDDFKTVNAAHGYMVGDEVLAAIPERVLSVTQAGDLLVRHWPAGDEFVLLACRVGSSGQGAGTGRTGAKGDRSISILDARRGSRGDRFGAGHPARYRRELPGHARAELKQTH
jgi:GGDEF domain-containing protein